MKWMRFPALLLAVGFFTACKPAPDPVIQRMNMTAGWTAEFEKRYPSPLGNLKSPPLFGRTGELGSGGRLSFILQGYPKDDLAPLLAWLSGKMRAAGVGEVTLDCLFPIIGSLLDKHIAAQGYEGDDAVRNRAKMEASPLSVATRILLKSDGTWSEGGNAQPPKLTFEGTPIH